MSFSQLTGRSAEPTARTSTRAVLVSILALAALLVLAAFRILPDSPSREGPQPILPAAESPPPTPTDNGRLHLAHAEQQLVTAQEQLAAARRLLAALSPQLSRSYLQFEKRRADHAWTACDAAQRSIEQALDDIKLVTATGKE